MQAYAAVVNIATLSGRLILPPTVGTALTPFAQTNRMACWGAEMGFQGFSAPGHGAAMTFAGLSLAHVAEHTLQRALVGSNAS